MQDRIREVTGKLEEYIRKEEYKGYDPYDGLMTPIMKMPILRSNKLIRLGFQQVIKRLPINIRKVIGIKKGLNPVTSGLAIQSYSYLSQVYPEKKEYYHVEIKKLLSKLIELKSKGFSGYCWGYDFDWDARYARTGAFQPTVVATSMITNGIHEYYKTYSDEEALKICESAADFVINDLNRTYEGENFCFSYSPFDKQVVYNATMKGARILVQAGKNLEEAKKTVEFVLRNQNENGAWSYAKGDARKWADNFHTGYILDCLQDYMELAKDESLKTWLDKGINYYVENFFYENRIPKYYDKRIYPIDATAIAQSILTLCRFGYIDMAKNVIDWAIDNMYDEKGYFYYRKYRYYTNKISYMRWSNAWMLTGLSYYLVKSGEKESAHE